MVILPHRRKAFRTVPASGGGGGDPYWNQVVLSLHGDGTDGSTTAIDSSNSAHTLTAAGNAQLDTAVKKFGTASLLFDGDDYFSIPDSTDWDFGTGDFAIELFVRYNGTEPASPRAVISSGAAGTISSFWTLEGRAGNKLGFFVSAFSTSVPILETTTTSWSNTWRFIQITRSGTTWKMYVDGVEEDSATSSVACDSNGGVIIGAGWYYPIGRGVNASIDEVRVTKGRTRANVVPTQAFPDFLDESVDPYWNQVSLLLHCDGTNGSTTITDSSLAPHTVTAYGNAQLSTASPKFGSGSITLDGSADYISIPASSSFNFGTGDVTIEFFISWFNLIGYSWILQMNGSLTLGILWGTTLFLSAGNTNIVAATITAPALNTWHHMAITRQGNNWNVYINGISVGSSTNSTALGNSIEPFVVGYYAGYSMAGKIDELRITKGVARYTSNFTPPTQAFPNS